MWDDFSLWHLLWYVILGSVAAWVAGRAFPGRGLGLRRNVAVGIAGAVLGGLFLLVIGLRIGITFLNIFWFPLWFVILGGLVGWLVGRAFLCLGRAGNVALGLVGGVGVGLGLLLIYIRFCNYLIGSLCYASVGTVLCLAIAFIFVRRR